MNAFTSAERRAIPESRMSELRQLALSSDDAERKVAQRKLQEIDAQIQARVEADANQQEAA